MAAPETSASSRLQLLQARFQQKQLQEKEQKLLQLYDQQQQRAHQVAQRGSAGSSGSNGSSGGIAKPMGKVDKFGKQVLPKGQVRQMFNERRQSTLKGIDKSYPLEPLGRRTNNTNGPPSIKKNISQVPNTRRNVGAKRTVATRADVNSNLSRESYASSRNPHNSTTRDSYGELRETGSIRQLNGYARNDQQHYEINIDDVIDNAAMERNRMLAKFDPAEIDKRRNLVGDLDEFSDDVPSKHNREKKTPPIPKKRTEVIPRESTFMKMTKSASLKVRKLKVMGKKKGALKKSKKNVEPVKNENWNNTLKSTSLVCQVIQSQKVENDDEKMGKVERIVRKIESATSKATKDQGEEESSEKPTDYQEIVVADQSIKIESSRKLSGDRIRRASFELKRMMFERIQSRDKIDNKLPEKEIAEEVTVEDSKPVERPCCQNKEKQEAKGFERHTCSWTFKTKKPNEHPKRKMTTRRKLFPKKLLQARDSIELARFTVKPKSCRRKVKHVVQDETEDVKSQSLPNAHSCTQIGNTDDDDDNTFSPRKTEIARGNAESKKNLTPYPSSKSPETTQEQKHRPEKENGYSSAAQKSYVSSSDTPDSAVTDSTNRSYDNEKPVVPATRTSSSLSSSSSIGTNRSQPLSNDRQTRQSVTKTKSTGVTPTSKSTFSPRNSISKQDDSLVSCKICKRRFMTDRIKFHEEICAKTTQKKRKQFDVVTHRVKGTELESFVQKKPSTKKQTKAPKPEAPKSNWRRKHEDFISAIRSAKQMQAHLAAGGKLSDLPPPPASDTSDYIQCPHCSRKFNQGAAERHIPKCETMLHNKPRAPVATRAKR